MGSSCGIVKPKDEFDEVVIPIKHKKYLKSAPPPDEKDSKIGKCYAEAPSSIASLQDWRKILFSQESQIMAKGSAFKKQLAAGIMKGIPTEYRWRAWSNIVLKGKSIGEEAYDDLVLVGEPQITVIRRDLDRSFPHEPYFNKDQFGHIGQAALERLLAKFANEYKEIGYCQGMNFVTGFLLIVSGGSEIEVYSFLHALCKDFSLEGFYCEGMPYLHKCVWVAKSLVKKSFDQLYEHLVEQSIPDDLWLLKWIMTVFTMILPGNVLVRVWDIFLIKGINVIFKTVLVILSYIEKDLLAKDSGDICEYFSALKSIELNQSSFIDAFHKFKVSKQTVTRLMNEYELTHYRSKKKIKEKPNPEEGVRLPPLKITKSTAALSRKTYIPTTIFRATSGSFSPTQSKPTKVPVLPEIRRPSPKKITFGVRSCEISFSLPSTP